MRPFALRNVLVATDLSDALRPALRTASELATLAGARLHIVHVEEKLNNGDGLAQHLRAAGLDPDMVTGARTLQGPAGAVIAQEAWRTEADVIILGPHLPEHDNPLGSTADRVVRAARAPCLILPVALSLPLRRVLVPVDISAGSRGILAVGLAWASALRGRGDGGASATLTALHVIPDESESTTGLAALQREVGLLSDRLSGLAAVEVQQRLEHGSDAASLIARHAEAGSCDLLVLGTRGMRDDDGALLGSVSSAVVRRVTRPVLLVPPAAWLDHAGDPLP